jgi:hypothetical protein
MWKPIESPAWHIFMVKKGLLLSLCVLSHLMWSSPQGPYERLYCRLAGWHLSTKRVYLTPTMVNWKDLEGGAHCVVSAGGDGEQEVWQGKRRPHHRLEPWAWAGVQFLEVMPRTPRRQEGKDRASGPLQEGQGRSMAQIKSFPCPAGYSRIYVEIYHVDESKWTEYLYLVPKKQWFKLQPLLEGEKMRKPNERQLDIFREKST